MTGRSGSRTAPAPNRRRLRSSAAAAIARRSQPRASTSMGNRAVLWEPTDDTVAEANLTWYMDWLRQRRGLSFADYASLWQWSVDDLGGFWHSIWDFYGVRSSAPYAQALADGRMPGARW